MSWWFQSALVVLAILGGFGGSLRFRRSQEMKPLETVRVIPTVGIQVEQSKGGSFWFGRKRRRCFVPLTNIKNVVINETIIRHRVITYLAILLKHPDSYGRLVVPLFEETLPRLNEVVDMYRQIHALIES